MVAILVVVRPPGIDLFELREDKGMAARALDCEWQPLRGGHVIQGSFDRDGVFDAILTLHDQVDAGISAFNDDAEAGLILRED
jgi:hypothetical protein